MLWPFSHVTIGAAFIHHISFLYSSFNFSFNFDLFPAIKLVSLTINAKNSTGTVPLKNTAMMETTEEM